MGFNVSTIFNVKPNLTGYYVYLVKQDELTGVAQNLLTDFNDYGSKIGENSAYIKANDTATNDFNYSLIMLMESNDWFNKTIGDWNHLPPGVIISKPSLQRFQTKKGDVFIYASGDVINKTYSNKIGLSQDIVDLCRYDIRPRNTQFIKNIIKYSRSTLIDPTNNETHQILQALYKSLILEPTFNGFGLNIKEFIDYFNKQEDTYDCIVKIF